MGIFDFIFGFGSSIFTSVVSSLAALVFVLGTAATVALLVILVRFLLVTTRAAQVYIDLHAPAKPTQSTPAATTAAATPAAAAPAAAVRKPSTTATAKKPAAKTTAPKSRATKPSTTKSASPKA